MPDWLTLLLTVVFAATLVTTTVLLAERFARVWAPIWIVGLLVGMSILFDYGGTKQTELQLFGVSLVFAAGPMMWPVLALGQDYLTEFYGPKLAYNYTVGMVLGKIGVALGTVWIIHVLPLPGSEELADVAREFNDLLGQAPRINIASIAALAVAFTVNPWVYHRMRKLTQGRRLWLRQQTAAVVALTLDAIIFFLGAFLFELPLSVIWEITWSYLVVAYATIFIDTAFLYGMVNVKRNGVFGIEDRIGERLTIETLRSQDAMAQPSIPTAAFEGLATRSDAPRASRELR
jgi:queuosine precursor transporter